MTKTKRKGFYRGTQGQSSHGRYGRKVLSWRLSNCMDASFCVDRLKWAIDVYGKSEIFNSDQGSQFTGVEFTGVLIDNGIAISMDGQGRAL